MDFTTAELFLLQSVVGDGIKTLESIKADNLRNSVNCIYSHQFVLNNTVIKAIDHRVEELTTILEKVRTEASDSEQAEQGLAAADAEKEVGEAV